MLPHSRLMLHDPLIGECGLQGSALKINSAAKDLMQTRETVGKILAQHTGHTLEEVLEKTVTDCYFSASEAVAWGLADCVTEYF